MDDQSPVRQEAPTIVDALDRPDEAWAGGPVYPAKHAPILARRFPAGMSLLLTIAALLIAAAAFSVDEVVVHADWAAGVRVAGIAALVLAGVTLAILTVRFAAGRRVVSTIMLSLILALVLAGAGVSGLTLSDPLHGLQARALEQKGDWPGAIYEYKIAGEHAPNAPNIARTYDEWGEQHMRQRQYKDAVNDFIIVVTQYGQSGAALDRAQSDLFNAYVAWVRAGDPAIPYGEAVAEIVSYRSAPSCDATCQTTARALEPQVRYQYGVQLIAQQQFVAAVEQFEIVQAHFPSSPYAAQSHMSAGQAYWALGQLQLQGTCADAVPTYQKLVKTYGDTPEGKQAKAALAAPQNVAGTISGFTDPTPVVYLSRSLSIGPGYFAASDDYRATVNSRGDFTFTSVKQGSYNLSAALYVSGGAIIYPYWVGSSNNLYFIHVGPLCPTQIGALAFK